MSDSACRRETMNVPRCAAGTPAAAADSRPTTGTSPDGASLAASSALSSSQTETKIPIQVNDMCWSPGAERTTTTRMKADQ